jgi:hypothetical protein
MWKLRIGIALLVCLSLAAHIGVILAFRHRTTIFVPGRIELVDTANFVLWSVQFAAALFCMSYSRVAVPWRHLWCTFWAASGALLSEFRNDQGRPDLSWTITIAITSLWTGYAIFVLGRWHFGTEFAPGNTTPAQRQWFFSQPVIMKWLIILTPVVMGNVILSQLTRSKFNAGAPAGAEALAWAILHAIFYFPLLSVMLMRRFAWILFSALAMLFAAMVIYDVSQVIFVNPPFALLKLQLALISMTPPLCIAFTLRFLGLRWQEAEPWPASAQPILKTAPNPFE